MKSTGFHLFFMKGILISTQNYHLRWLQQNDAEQIQSLANDYEIAKSTLNLPYPYTLEHANSWINQTLINQRTGDVMNLAITAKFSGEILGVIGLIIDHANKIGEAGYWIGKSSWNKGIATEALKALITYAFEELKLNKVHAKHFTDNPASGCVMQKSGMHLEGTFRFHVLRFEQIKHMHCYAIINPLLTTNEQI